ncbi:MAG: hypothetical protein Sw1PiTSA_11800 [Shewanella algae]
MQNFDLSPRLVPGSLGDSAKKLPTMPSPSLQIHSSGFTKRCKWLLRTIRPFQYMAKVGRQLEPVIDG